MSISNLRFTNKKPSSKKEDLIELSFRKSITLLDNESKVVSINALQ